MTMIYRLTDDVGTGTRVALSGNDDLFVGANATVLATTGTAVTALGDYNAVTVKGAVVGSRYGILAGDLESGADTTGTEDTRIQVAQGGIVSAEGVGVGLSSWRGVLVNEGDILGQAAGVWARVAGPLQIENAGTISGQMGVILQGAWDSGMSTSRTVNTGMIQGTEKAFQGSDATDVLVNRGAIHGRVDLGQGSDTYDGRGGTVEGTVEGGDGMDRFLPGAGEEFIDGGAGWDTLDFRGSEGLRVSLLDDSGTGRAAGDRYYGIEIVKGSRTGADQIIGDGGENTLQGLGGADQLDGQWGNDSLIGGDGRDVLTGGSGDDRFVFGNLAGAGDRIRDFGQGDDTIVVALGDFGLDLLTGTLEAGRLRVRADNTAQDADDRFVFRTTDRTLWLDADGNGGDGPILLADLQAGAVLTAADILIGY